MHYMQGAAALAFQSLELGVNRVNQVGEPRKNKVVSINAACEGIVSGSPMLTWSRHPGQKITCRLDILIIIQQLQASQQAAHSREDGIIAKV